MACPDTAIQRRSEEKRNGADKGRESRISGTHVCRGHTIEPKETPSFGPRTQTGPRRPPSHPVAAGGEKSGKRRDYGFPTTLRRLDFLAWP